MKKKFALVSAVLILSILFLGLFTSIASAQEDGYVSIFVWDQETTDPIVGAKIGLEMEDATYTSETDSTGIGYFVLPNAETLGIPEDAVISASKSGYITEEEEVTIYGSTSFSISLAKSETDFSMILFTAVIIILLFLIVAAFFMRLRFAMVFLIVLLLITLVLVPVTNNMDFNTDTEATTTDSGRFTVPGVGFSDALHVLPTQETLVFDATMKVRVSSLNNINGQWIEQSGFTTKQTYLYKSDYQLYSQVFNVEYRDPKADLSALSLGKMQQDNPETHNSIYLVNGQTAVADGGSRRDDEDLTRRSSGVGLSDSNVGFDFGSGLIPDIDLLGIAGSLAGRGAVSDAPAVLYNMDELIVEETWVLPAFVGYTFKIKNPISDKTVFSATLFIPKLLQRVQPPGAGGPQIVEAHKINLCLPMATRFQNGIVEWEIIEVESGGTIAYERIERVQPRFKEGWGSWDFPLFNTAREMAKKLFPRVRARLEEFRPDEYRVINPGRVATIRNQFTGGTRKRYNLIGF